MHVLGAPPAFVLSQDQTLCKMVSERPCGRSDLTNCSTRQSLYFAGFRFKKISRVFVRFQSSIRGPSLLHSLFIFQGAAPTPVGRAVWPSLVAGTSFYYVFPKLSTPFFRFFSYFFDKVFSTGFHRWFCPDFPPVFPHFPQAGCGKHFSPPLLQVFSSERIAFSRKLCYDSRR